LYDTYGTPRDLIRIGLEERNFKFTDDYFDEKFDAALRELQQTGATGKTEQKTKARPIYADIASRIQSLFRGYETTRVDDAKVLGVICGDEELEELSEGREGELVLDQTPFYAESGGQVGDVGRMWGPPATAGGSDLVATVLDTYSPVQGVIIHKVRIEKGWI